MKDNRQVRKTSHTSWTDRLIGRQISKLLRYCIFFISEFSDSLDSEFSFSSEDEDECENTSLPSDSLIEFSNELLNLETSDSEFYQHDIITEKMWVIPTTQCHYYTVKILKYINYTGWKRLEKLTGWQCPKIWIFYTSYSNCVMAPY